jgi:uncharacterized UPF0160 family protein
MSTSINQIIEVYKDGKWQYVPLAKKVTQDNNCLQKCGSVRDIFAYKWHNADSFIQCGVPEDISKLAREAMIYDDQDFITSGACWISAAQYEALTEEIRQKYLNTIEKLSNAKLKDEVTKRLDKIEGLIKELNGKIGVDEPERNEDDSEVEWIQEELEDMMWAWVNMERNWAEIEAYVSYFTNDDYRMSDIRVIMFVS